MSCYDTFINNLNYFMSIRGLTRYKLAEETGISYSTLSGIFLGGYFPRAKHIDELAKALNISTADLFLDSSTEEKEIIARYKNNNEIMKSVEGNASIKEMISLLHNTSDEIIQFIIALVEFNKYNKSHQIKL